MKSAGRISVLIADDHPIVRQGIVSMIQSREDMTVCAEVENGQQAILAFKKHNPDVSLIDLKMPVCSGTEAIQEIMKEFPQAKILVFTTYDGDEDIHRSMKAGALGYVLKDAKPALIIEGIRTVFSGRKFLPAPVAKILSERIPGSDLTDRELEVLQLMARGASNKEIAAVMGITEGTVKGKVNSILAKLGVDDRTEAVTRGLQRGLIRI